MNYSLLLRSSHSHTLRGKLKRLLGLPYAVEFGAHVYNYHRLALDLERLLQNSSQFALAIGGHALSAGKSREHSAKRRQTLVDECALFFDSEWFDCTV